MNCKIDPNLLMLYVASEVSPGESAEIGRHLKVCRECQKIVQGWQELQQQLQEFDIDFVPPAINLHEIPLTRGFTGSKIFRTIPLKPRWALAIAAGILALAVFFLQRWLRAPADPWSLAESWYAPYEPAMPQFQQILQDYENDPFFNLKEVQK
ncbi:MAG: zf-HC2 domain-containing protein [Calditrichaeota bacterium]|nr:MAG: zf-HC2 domain-containing protein [Calditrichota bacterium]